MTTSCATVPSQSEARKERVVARAAPWLAEESHWTSGATEVLRAERYAGALFRAFLAVMGVRLQRPTARVSTHGICWRTSGGRIEDLRCEPYLAPSEQDPNRPLIVRVVVNKGPAGDVEIAARENGLLAEDAEPRPPRWSHEIVVMPGELLRFAPYIVRLVHAFEADLEEDEETVVEPPMPTTLVEEHNGIWAQRSLYEWSERARSVLETKAWTSARVPTSA